MRYSVLRDFTGVFVDEAGHVSDAAAYTIGCDLVQQKMQQHKPRIKSIDVPCRRCGALAGTKCVQWRQRRSRQLYKAHKIRVEDARLADQALDALKPR